MMKRVEIRCCCDCRVLGTVPYVGDTLKLTNGELLLLDPFLDGIEQGKAYKSNDYPLEVLEQISGWEAA